MVTTPPGSLLDLSGTLENLNVHRKYNINADFEPPDPQKRNLLQIFRFCLAGSADPGQENLKMLAQTRPNLKSNSAK